MSAPVHPENSITASTEPAAASDSGPDNSLLNQAFDVDQRKFCDLALSIRPGAKNEEDPEAINPEDDEKKNESAAEKESSDWKETADDPSVSFSNYTDLKPETHGSGQEGTEEETEVNAKMGPLIPLTVTSPHVETAPVFDRLPDEIILLIFKSFGVRDRLRLEAVKNSRWHRLLMESWKDVRVLKVSEIFSPSLTDKNIEFLRKRVGFVKRLEFERPPESHRFKTKTKTRRRQRRNEWVIARRIFSSLCSPPCGVKEVVITDRMLDRSTLFSLTRIGDQITSLILLHEYEEPSKREDRLREPIEDMEDGRSFFEYFPNLITLKCIFPGVWRTTGIQYNRECWASLPTSSIENLHYLDCWGWDDHLADFLNMDEPFPSVRKLKLDGVDYGDSTTLSGLGVRFPSLEILDIQKAGYAEVLNPEVLRPLKNLRKLYLSGFMCSLDIGFLSHAYSFPFRKKLKTFCITTDPERSAEFLPQEHLENISCFPNLKHLSVESLERGRVELDVEGIEKIAKGCKKLRRVSLDPAEGMNDEALGILAANCPDLRKLKVAGSHVTKKGKEACKITNPNLKVCLRERIEVESTHSSDSERESESYEERSDSEGESEYYEERRRSEVESEYYE